MKDRVDYLLLNLEKVHTTPMGICRIKRNLSLGDIDVVLWVREKILDRDSLIYRRGKNWYIENQDVIITVNASSYTIITAHRRKG